MDKYIASLYPEKGFFTTILPQMKVILKIAKIRSTECLKNLLLLPSLGDITGQHEGSVWEDRPREERNYI